MKSEIKLLMLASTVVFIGLVAIHSSRQAEIIKPRPEMKTPSAAFERQQYFLIMRLPAGVEQLPMDPYRQAINDLQQQAVFSTKQGRLLNQLEKSASSSSKATVTGWEWLGPGNVGGRTRALVFHPEQNDTMYAAGVSGGIWKTTNGGDSWQVLADNMANINVGCAGH